MNNNQNEWKNPSAPDGTEGRTAPAARINQRRKQKQQLLYLVQLALLTAVILVLQLTGVAIRLPIPGATNISLVLIPVALGAMLLGPVAGAFLGLVFGLVVYITGGVMHLDPFTAFLFDSNPIVTAGICLIKSTLAGFLAGWIYKLLSKKSTLLAVFVAAAIVPVVNTAVFCLGCLVILDTIKGFMSANSIGGTALYFIFIGCAGLNFVFEFAVNMIFSPALERLVRLLSKKIRR